MTVKKFLSYGTLYIVLLVIGIVWWIDDSRPEWVINDYMEANYNKRVKLLEDVEDAYSPGGDGTILVALKDQPEMKFHIMVYKLLFESSFTIAGNKYEEAQKLYSNFNKMEPFKNDIKKIDINLFDLDDMNRLYFLHSHYGETLYFTQSKPLDIDGLVEEDVTNYYSLVELVKSSGAEVERILIDITSRPNTRITVENLEKISSEEDLLDQLLLTNNRFRAYFEMGKQEENLMEIENERISLGRYLYDENQYLTCKEISNVDYCDVLFLYLTYTKSFVLDEEVILNDISRIRRVLEENFPTEAAIHVNFSAPNFGAIVYHFLDRSDEQILSTIKKGYNRHND